MASGSNNGKPPELPKGLIDRRGTPAGKARLPSLRGPRDLTLGGVQRKVFVPNIPARKEKAKEEASSSKDQTDGKQDGKKSRDRDSARGRSSRGRGRGRGQENLIQIHSHFEQGPTGQARKGWGSSSEGGGGGGGGGDRISSAPRVKQENTKAAVSSRNLDHLMRDDFVADGPADDPTLLPVMLPMCDMAKAEVKKVKEEKATPSKSIVKEEPVDDTDAISTASSEKAMSISSSSGRSSPSSDDGKELTCKQLLKRTTKSEKEELIFLQLPDVLPGHPPTQFVPSGPDAKGDANGQRKEDRQANEDAQKPASCSLTDFSEGYVGKLRVRKSGKTELVLGSVVLDVSMGTPCGFLQDVVSIRTDEGDSRMTVLGHLQHRMICTPNFESLLKSTSNT